ncbi:MAG: hypothetical protein QGI83_07705 [Candidatus Latescibacteria bacterium]|jgi:hypothetical protein|nr:hypothetical protein [Candidatus Latescibacterota bacterium]
MSAAWRAIKFAFSRPPIAATLVGASIHGLLEINGHVFGVCCHVGHLAEVVGDAPAFGLLYLLIPFGVPFGMTQVGKRIVSEYEQECELRFPQANPDLVLKLDSSGEIVFANAAAEALPERVGLPRGEVKALLPSDTPSVVAEALETGGTLTRMVSCYREQVEYRFRAISDEDAVFVSGREAHRKEEEP